MADPLSASTRRTGASTTSTTDTYDSGMASADAALLDHPLPTVLADLAQHVARLAEQDEIAGHSHRPLVWAGVRFGRGLADQGAAHEALERGLDVVRDTALHALEERATSDGWSAGEQRLTAVVVIARRAARLGFHARMLEGMGAWDSAVQELLRQATPPITIEPLR